VAAYETLLYDVADGVATIALNQPDTRNALSEMMLDELLEVFAAARDDDDVRCVVLASTHPKTWSSGANLGGFAGDVPLIHRHLGTAGKLPQLFDLIGALGKPSIVKAAGHVLAGALGLALACDLIVASQDASFGTPEINVGVFPFVISALIVRNVGRKKAAELMLLGERIDAAEAHRIGIVNRVVPASELDTAVAEWAAKLAASSPLIMRLGKEALYRQIDMGQSDAMEFLRAQLTLAQSTDDIREGVTAFFEKREPQWTGH
jgi:enoyl-CoA hydratase